MSKDTGGFVHPQEFISNGVKYLEAGMTLLDYFAAHCPMPFDPEMSWQEEAVCRYAYASAMIAQRTTP